MHILPRYFVNIFWEQKDWQTHWQSLCGLSIVAVWLLVGKCMTVWGDVHKCVRGRGEDRERIVWTSVSERGEKEEEFVREGCGFGHLPSDKISWQGNQRETNSAATRVQLCRSSPWWAFEKWSVVEIGFVWEASYLSLVRIIATCLHWLQRSVN